MLRGLVITGRELAMSGPCWISALGLVLSGLMELRGIAGLQVGGAEFCLSGC
jgi:hypothetical protein